MTTIQIPAPVPFTPTTPGPRRLPEDISFLQFVGLVLGNVTGTLELAQAISRTKKALSQAASDGLDSFEISEDDHRMLVAVCRQRQMHMLDFEQLESFFSAILGAEAGA